MLSTRDPPQNESDTQTKIKGWEKVFHANGNEKKAGLSILIIYKIDFKTNAYSKRQRRTHHNDKRSNPARGCNSGKYLCT